MGSWRRTEGRDDTSRDARVNKRLAEAQGGPCKHANVTVKTIRDRRTDPPTITETITCDDCRASL